MTGSSWGLTQYVLPGVGPRTGLIVNGVVHTAPADLARRPVLRILGDWPLAAPRLRAINPAAGSPVPDARLIAPITYPRKVVCAGANYYGHAAEMGTARPDGDAAPFFFLKPPTTTIVGAGARVAYPSDRLDVRLDWEAEVAVVIGRTARHIPPGQAREHIAGYAAANDLSAREPFTSPDAVMAPFAFDWLRHKGQDGFCPLGPAIVPSWLVDDPQDLCITLTVNGRIKQRSTTADMVIDIPRLVSAASEVITLEPGDVLLTGTPAGVGLPRDEYLYPGDVVTVSITGLGTLTTIIGLPDAEPPQFTGTAPSLTSSVTTAAEPAPRRPARHRRAVPPAV
jgi:2-keto-4-pentenoate hydratase/2-oxohepta-3-ene-1,7-dioic acid hydratase in catechol pathway